MPTITLSPSSLPAARLNSPYSQTISASGGIAPYSFAVVGGALPNGLMLASGGLLSGTPRSLGPSTFRVRAAATNGCAGTNTYTLTVNCPVIALSPSSGALPPGTQNVGYSQTIFASGGSPPYTFMLAGGALPNGLNLGNSGAITGTPTKPGQYSFYVSVTDTNGCGSFSNQYTLTIDCPAITLSPSTLPAGMLGVPYSQTISASGGSGSYRFSVISGSLPPNFTLTTGGTLTGTPTTQAPYTFTVQAMDTNNCTGTRTYTLSNLCPTITLSPSALPSFLVGEEGGVSLSASGGTAPYSFAVISGSLPSGFSLGSSGVLLGMFPGPESSSFTVQATDANGCTGIANYTLTVQCPNIQLIGTLPSGTVNVSYSAALSANGGTSPYTFSLSAGALPTGLMLANTGLVTGTPTTPGTANFTVTVSDAYGCSNSYNQSITISNNNNCTNGFTFADFGSNALAGNNLQLNGSAAAPVLGLEGTPVLRLTPAAYNQAGSAFLPVQLDANLSFSNAFAFQMSSGGGVDKDPNEPPNGTEPPGADGIVFVLAAAPTDLGVLGQGVGYQGIPASVGIKFDTWQDGVANGFPGDSDPNGNFVAVYTDGNIQTAGYVPYSTANLPTVPQYYSPPTYMKNGDIWYAWIEYDGASSQLEVRLSDGVNVRPTTPQLVQTLSLNNLSFVGASGMTFAGFTSGTGGQYDDNDILNWQFSSPCANACLSIQCSNLVVVTCSNCTSVPFSATASDLCCSNVSLQYDPAPDTCFAAGTTTTVKVVATDDCGNSVSNYFTVRVIGCTNFTCLSLVCPTNIEVTTCSNSVCIWASQRHQPQSSCPVSTKVTWSW